MIPKRKTEAVNRMTDNAMTFCPFSESYKRKCNDILLDGQDEVNGTTSVIYGTAYVDRSFRNTVFGRFQFSL
jgi:hypothetical protein